MRYLYTFLFYLTLPLVLIRLLWRSLHQPAYRQRLAERFGYLHFQLEKSIWVHAVSMGETLAAVPLIKALQSRYPHIPMIITTMTLTGAECVKKTFGDSVIHAYIPYDLPSAVQRFIRHARPLVCVIMETELWPNLIAVNHKNNIPICLVNARLSEKSARGYHRISSLTKDMLQQIDCIAAHGYSDAERLIKLGAPKERVVVTGNIKFDLSLPSDLIARSTELRSTLGKDRLVWIAASTHEGEEEIILAAHEKISKQIPQVLLILVPRHPNRFDAIAKLSQQSFKTSRRSLKEAVTGETSVYLGDTMGELLLLYGASDIAFVAGSLIPRGGHNMLEPGALGKPILTGPHLFNFAEISELFVKANALTKVIDAETLAQQILQLAQNQLEREQMGARALQVVVANRGALAKQIEMVCEKMD